MISQEGLPDGVSALFPEGAAAGRSLGVQLPPGRLVTSEEAEEGERPALWLSDQPVAPGLWARLRAEHARSGLWPLLLDAMDDEEEDYRPWGNGEVFPGDMSPPDRFDPDVLLELWWEEHTKDREEDLLTPSERAAVIHPYGRRWPGPAGVPERRSDPDRTADALAEQLLTGHPTMRLGLVAVDRGADALAVSGWAGPGNYIGDTAQLSAVLRDWEDRFGIRVVGVGFATLLLSVAAPPATHADALLVAAEHFALCPDNVWQSPEPQNTLSAYAQHLVGDHSWAFWWD